MRVGPRERASIGPRTVSTTPSGRGSSSADPFISAEFVAAQDPAGELASDLAVVDHGAAVDDDLGDAGGVPPKTGGATRKIAHPPGREVLDGSRVEDHDVGGIAFPEEAAS